MDRRFVFSLAEIKKRLSEDRADSSVPSMKRPRLNNETEKENWKKLSLTNKVEVRVHCRLFGEFNVDTMIKPKISLNVQRCERLSLG